MKHQNFRKHIIPNIIFHKLFDGATQYTSKDIYVQAYSNQLSDDYINLKGILEIDHVAVIELLSKIYDISNMSFKDILLAAGKRKSEVSHIFCIHIRTVEDWYSGKNRCPSYVRLMLLKEFHLLDLGKYIYLKSEEDYKNTKPRIYKYTKRNKVKVNENSSADNDIFKPYLEEEEEDEDFLLEYERIVKRKNERISHYKEMHFSETSASHKYDEIEELLKKTDYLKNRKNHI